MRVGYIGLGNMGRAQVGRLLEEGVDLLVWNRTAERAQGIPAPFAETPAQVMAECEVVFLCLFDGRAVREVAEGPDGLFAAPRREGKVVVDSTTNGFDDAVAHHRDFGRHGLAYLEAPVLGSVVPARQGRLVALVSGQESPFTKVQPLLGKLAEEVVYMPPPGSATKMKLVANLLLGVTMAGVAEAVALGETAGLPRDRVLDVLEFGPASKMVAAKREMILSGDFTPHFAADAMHKDLVYAGELASDLEVPVQVADAARLLFARSLEDGRGQEDMSVVFETIERPQFPPPHDESEAEAT